jgi:hypothetical protein
MPESRTPAVAKVIVLATLERGAECLLQPDAKIRSALLRIAAIFGAVVTVTAVALASVPFNMMPVPRPLETGDLLYLIPQALPIAVLSHQDCWSGDSQRESVSGSAAVIRTPERSRHGFAEQGRTPSTLPRPPRNSTPEKNQRVAAVQTTRDVPSVACPSDA